MKRERLVSLDVLRIIAMLMIVCFHVELHGGVLEASVESRILGSMNRLIFAASYCCVNLYVLISAYMLSASDELKVSKILKLETQVLFFSIVLHLAACFVGIVSVRSLRVLFKAYLPTSHNDQYWFFTVYVGMYILHPFINKALRAMGQWMHAMLVGLLIGFCMWNDLTPLNSIFLANAGFSLIWFLAVYIIGAYIRYYVTTETIKRGKWLFVYVSATAFATIFWIVAYYVLGMFHPSFKGVADYFYRYDSTLILVQSIALFMVFLGTKVQNKRVVRATAFLSPLTFGIYLFHDNLNFKGFMWKSILHTDTMDLNWLMLPKIILIVLAVFMTGAIVEYLRQKLFGMFERTRRYKEIMEAADRLPNKLVDVVLRTFGERKGNQSME